MSTRQLNLAQWYKILAPRPAVLISTINAKGVSNAAPFSFVMPTSCDPPLIAFASSPEHHTVKNILETEDFVVNVPGHEMLKELWICADVRDEYYLKKKYLITQANPLMHIGGNEFASVGKIVKAK